MMSKGQGIQQAADGCNLAAGLLDDMVPRSSVQSCWSFFGSSSLGTMPEVTSTIYFQRTTRITAGVMDGPLRSKEIVF